MNHKVSAITKLKALSNAAVNKFSPSIQNRQLRLPNFRQITANAHESLQEARLQLLQKFLPELASRIENQLKKNKTIRKYWWRLHIKFPWIYYSEHRYRDFYTPAQLKLQNEETRLTDGETAKVSMFWATEAYGPSEIDILYSGLSALEWDFDRYALKGGGCIDWIKRQRQIGTSGTFNLGYVRNHGNEQSMGHNFYADLPEDVDYVKFTIHQICPSLTCIQAGFVLKNEAQNLYEEELQLDRDVRVDPIKVQTGAHKYSDPHHLKQEAIEDKRQKLKKMAFDWINDYFPGIFCSASFKLPTAELIITQNIALFDDTDQLGLREWSRIVSQTSYRSSWKCDKQETLQFGLHEQDNNSGNHIVATLAAEKVSEKDISFFGSRANNAYAPFGDEYLSGILVRFAVLSLLNFFRKDLMQTRDKLRIASPHKKRALKSLNYIQRFFNASIQVPSIVGEIAELTKNKNAYNFYCRGFSELNPFDKESPGQLHVMLATSTHNKATRLLQDDRSTRDSFKQISEVVTARESVKAQRRMEVFTICTVILASWSVWLALPGENTNAVKNYFAQKCEEVKNYFHSATDAHDKDSKASSSPLKAD